MALLPTDIVDMFGQSYISIEQFKAVAGSFGASVAILGMDDNDIQSLLSQSSRAVEAACQGKNFSGGVIVENHKWDTVSRRIRVNSPPVAELVQYQIQTAPGQFTTFPNSAVYINNQESYIELAALTVAGALTSQLLSLGLMEIQCIVQYKSYQTVPQKIKMATGMIAADLAQRAKAALIVIPGLNSMSTVDKNVSRATPVLRPGDWPIPDYAQVILNEFTSIYVL